ncbi:hypothetical protein DPEC_G00135800 [Dallia pectoralis]|uniref:Uncharacterized protein n=1 Tax=Dallia pectoralis TaxID=75939 RepID=A0ACC2GLP3_DALPE|nr:hypothetical protein DPEC_G00135800 [Dallia pectoralis]
MYREDKPNLQLSFHAEIKQESLDPDCDISGAQCGLVDSEMTSVKLEDCSQSLGLSIVKYEEEEKNGVVIKDEEEEQNIEDLTNQDEIAGIYTSTAAIKHVDWSEDIIENARVCSAHFISGEASLDSSSPDYVPSVFVYTKPSQNPEAKLERYHRKRRRDDSPITAANLCVPSKTLIQECSMDHCPAEDDVPVKKREYDDLNQRHSQLKEDYLHLCQKFEALQAENVKLKEELQKTKEDKPNLQLSFHTEIKQESLDPDCDISGEGRKKYLKCRGRTNPISSSPSTRRSNKSH